MIGNTTRFLWLRIVDHRQQQHNNNDNNNRKRHTIDTIEDHEHGFEDRRVILIPIRSIAKPGHGFARQEESSAGKEDRERTKE